MLPNPTDCRKYYVCFNGLAYTQQCPDNLYWSSLNYRCDYRQYATCDYNNLTPVTIPETIQYTPYPNDCSRYYETRILSCPNNYHWNVRLQRCDLPQFAGCDLYTATIPPYTNPIPINPILPTAATPPPPFIQPTLPAGSQGYPIDPDYICKTALGKKYLPYPGDCFKFIYCGQTAQVITCPPELYWNVNTQSCGTSKAGCIFNL